MSIMSEDEVLKIYKSIDALLEGHFILSSGLHSRMYLQSALVFSNTKIAESLCKSLSAKVKNLIDIDSIDLIVSPAMGGVIVGYELSRHLNKINIFFISPVPEYEFNVPKKLYDLYEKGLYNTPLFQNKNCYVDYAHTPDALKSVLDYLRSSYKGKIITLFGCGGERDSSKRGDMGKIAQERSDFQIITNDNPRNEDPKKIVDQIIKDIAQSEAEIDQEYQLDYTSFLNRLSK